jgi:hypothetical protein
MKKITLSLFFIILVSNCCFNQNIIRKKVILAIESCPNGSDFNFCFDGNELFMNSRHFILSPEIKPRKFSSFYGDTVLIPNNDFYSRLINIENLKIIETEDFKNVVSFKLNAVKRIVNRYLDKNRSFDGYVWFKYVCADIEFVITSESSIDIFRTGLILDRNLFTSKKVVVGRITNIFSVRPYQNDLE